MISPAPRLAIPILFAVVFILCTVGLKALAGRFRWEGVLAMDQAWVRWATDGLMGVVLLLTLLSGLAYLTHRRSVGEGS